MEPVITIQLVHGGFILTAPESLDKFGIETTNYSGNYRTEVFTSQGKLMKALRASIEAHSLLEKPKKDADETLLDKVKTVTSHIVHGGEAD